MSGKNQEVQDEKQIVPNADDNNLTIPMQDASMSNEKLGTIEEMLNDIDEAEEGVHLTYAYWNVEERKEVRGVFVGFTVMTVDEKDEVRELPAVKIMTKEGGILAAQTKAVQAFVGIEVPAKVLMRYNGKTKTSNGNHIHQISVVRLK